YLTLWGAFTFVYIFIPNTRVRLRSALAGGLIAAILWQTVGWGFAVFVASSTRYYVIYSSFAILLLFLLWLHIGWVIVLLGAQVSYAHQHIHYFLGERDLLAQSTAGRDKLALLMMLFIGRNFRQGLAPLSVADLAVRLRIPAGVVKEFMVMLAGHRLVVPLAEEETFVLARDPATITIKEILDCVRNAGKTVDGASQKEKEDKVIDAILRDVDQAAARTLEGKNLQALILSLEQSESRR
ncbi:MAG TPA: YhjD/YihY/BrkB family envelope integrity protein, partial [Candidatus Binatia bacterium]|nr:YhjD/YihY/BrkB family envelope integrity protein [Candidatus Binatia bacterium]